MRAGLGREDIRALLDDLSAELAARGARAKLFLVGGAALAVAYDATRATRDLDAVGVRSQRGRPAGCGIGRGPRGTGGRLNDAVKGSCPAPIGDAQRSYGVPDPRTAHRCSRTGYRFW